MFRTSLAGERQAPPGHSNSITKGSPGGRGHSLICKLANVETLSFLECVAGSYTPGSSLLPYLSLSQTGGLYLLLFSS